jgi:hypothetical protein
MIRRDIQLQDGAPYWLLISQRAHARLSGELARAWSEELSEEVLAGIAHHDDGWLEWEAAPQLDSNGRPLSFTELDISDAIAIWDRSIAAARSIGPLAGAIVAGHFVGLARGSEQATDPYAEKWLRDMSHERDAWLAEWKSVSPSHTPRVAERAQQMLLVADLLSLWLCCDGPITGKGDSSQVNTEMRDRTVTILGKYRFRTHDQSISEGQSPHDRPAAASRTSKIAWEGRLEPWPLATDSLQLAAPAVAVPAAKYGSWRELAEASRAVQLVWRLRETLPDPAEC